jgi:hypothetical protein
MKSTPTAFEDSPRSTLSRDSFTPPVAGMIALAFYSGDLVQLFPRNAAKGFLQGKVTVMAVFA